MNQASLVIFLLFLASSIAERTSPCVGCPQEADSNSKEIADQVTASLDQTNSNVHLHKVINCTKQVVSGVKHKCDIEVTGASNDIQTCTIEFLSQPWISPKPQVLSETCSQLRSKRETCPGCAVEHDPSSENMKKLIKSALGQFNSNLVLHRGTKCSSQIVSGVLYRCEIEVKSSSFNGVRTCEISFLSQPWKDEQPQLTSETCSKVNSVQTPVGGFTPVTNLESIQDVAKYGAEHVSHIVNSPFMKGIVQIFKAEKQVVSGTKYMLSMELADTNCLKSQYDANSICGFSPKPVETIICDVLIYDAPWKNERKIEDINCKNSGAAPSVHRVRRSGAEEDISVDSDVVKRLTSFVSAEITQRTNANNYIKVVKTLEAKKQIVSGQLITLKVLVGETDCPSNTNSIDNCSVAEADKICELTVWEQPWINSRTVKKFSCEQHDPGMNTDDEDLLTQLPRVLNVNKDEPELHQFNFFISSYKKNYLTTEETRFRYRIFRANMKKIKYLQETEQGTGEYGATVFADLTSSEFKQYLGLKSPRGHRFPSVGNAVIPNISLPQSYDWRDYGIVTPVKNQGQCGSCWAFSVTGNIEGQYALKNKKLISLSEQELVDCDRYDDGCNGGLFDTAFRAIEELGGLETEDAYPYEAKDDKCQFKKRLARVSITSSVNISTDENDMARWLTSNGPISVALNANAMQFYMGGVSHPLKFLCSPKSLDHGVLIVGYGVHTTSILHRKLPYWIVKNSWGPSWGKQGYYWLYRGDGSCGVNQMPTSAVL